MTLSKSCKQFAGKWRSLNRSTMSDALLQALGVGERALAIIVFGLQIGAYRRIELKRIAHHFAPVLRLEPGEVSTYCSTYAPTKAENWREVMRDPFQLDPA